MMLYITLFLDDYSVLMQYTSREVYEHISIQTNDPIVEWKICRASGQEFPIYQTDLDFYNTISPTFETQKKIGDKLITQFPTYYSRTDTGKLKVQIPTPTLCPEERQRRRLAFRNERKLYKRKCDFTGKDIVSIYSPDKLYTVYDQEVWRDYEYEDYSQLPGSFSSGFLHLLGNIPKQSLYNKGCQNSTYGNNNIEMKDSYMSFCSGYGDSCLYFSTSGWVKSSIDGYWALYVENSFEIIDSSKVYGSYYINHSENIHFSYFLNDCINCQSCFMCNNLQNRKFCIRNKQYSREEYLTYIGNRSDIRSCINEFYGMISQSIKSNQSLNVDNSWGHNIKNSKCCIFCKDVIESYGCRYCEYVGLNAEYCYDCYGDVFQISFSYESGIVAMGESYLFCQNCLESNIIFYSTDCYGCSNLFGCVGLRNKQYCIFNKQYTKEQRHSFVPQLIARMIRDGERGEFFDPSLSPFGYNETVAQEYFPLTKEEALARGYKRSNYSADPVIPANAQVLRANDVSLEEWTQRRDDDAILRQVIICEVSQRPFMIQKMELDFYRKHNLPLPRKHPDIRHKERMKLRPGRTLHLRTCDKCGEEMLSVYPKVKGQEQKVYCEKCYQQEVFR